MSKYCYIRGEFVPMGEARVSPDDLGMFRGYAVYEGITAVNGVPFHFHEHFMRLAASASAIGLSFTLDEQTVYEAAVELAKLNAPNAERTSFRVILSGGVADHGIIYVPENTLFYMTADISTAHTTAFHDTGVKIITHEYQRPLPKCKTTDYITPVSLQSKRIAADAAEILYVQKGNITECSTANIFMVKDGVLITPKDNILYGITRGAVLELAEAEGINTEVRNVTLAELLTADEVFITSSFRDILPIVKVDETTIAQGIPGPVTKQMMRIFSEELRS